MICIILGMLYVVNTRKFIYESFDSSSYEMQKFEFPMIFISAKTLQTETSKQRKFDRC